MFKGKKRIIILLITGIGIFLCFLWNIHISANKKEYIQQIETIVSNCAKNNIDRNSIDKKYGEKIYHSIQDNWDEEGGIKLEDIECKTYDENWSEQNIWVTVDYKGKLSNDEEVSESESFEVFFDVKGGKVYISKVGISVGESGVSDLDK